MLQAALGADYGAHNEATATAGYLVTNYMRQLGHRDTGSAKLPAGCVAKSGKLFEPARASRPMP